MPHTGPVSFRYSIVNDDITSTKDRLGIAGIVRAHLVVVDHRGGVLIPDFDSELIAPAAAINVSINCRQHESVIAAAVNSARAFELSARPGDHQPIVSCTLEI